MNQDPAIDQALKRVAKELNAEIWDLPVTELEIVAQEIRQKLDTGVIKGGAVAYAKKRLACIDVAIRGMKRLIEAHR